MRTHQRGVLIVGLGNLGVGLAAAAQYANAPDRALLMAVGQVSLRLWGASEGKASGKIIQLGRSKVPPALPLWLAGRRPRDWCATECLLLTQSGHPCLRPTSFCKNLTQKGDARLSHTGESHASKVR